MANTDKPLPGYESVFGNKKVFMVDHYGPANYQAGGENYNASALNWGGFERVEAGRSFSGTYTVSPQYSNNNNATGTAFSTVQLLWYASNGTQVANNSNLNAEVVRMFLIGV